LLAERSGAAFDRRGAVEHGSSRHCEERLVRRSSTSEGGSDEAIQLLVLRRHGLLRGSLSSGAHSRDPLARNDKSQFISRLGSRKRKTRPKHRPGFKVRARKILRAG
jgi:hypothetical protein